MLFRSLKSLPLTVCFAAAPLVGCAGSGTDDVPGGTGGSIDPTGGTGTGGSLASGGSGGSSSGGTTNTGGTSTGGATITGGTAGSGGATGGAGGSGGQVGTGGSTGGDAGTGGSASQCPAAEPLTGGTEYCQTTKDTLSNGYGFERWGPEGTTGCMTVYGQDATFGAEWTDVEDFLARVGLDFDRTRTHQQIGTITAEFAETKEDDGGLTYIGIYGWTVEPLREFYIIDDWGSAQKPGGTSSDGTPRDEVGTLEADGETYDVWKKTRVDKPAITGDSETFDQYFSIRRTARQCGTISVSEHFSAWEELGIPLGNLTEVKLLVESQFNSGSIEFTTATVTVD